MYTYIQMEDLAQQPNTGFSSLKKYNRFTQWTFGLLLSKFEYRVFLVGNEKGRIDPNRNQFQAGLGSGTSTLNFVEVHCKYLKNSLLYNLLQISITEFLNADSQTIALKNK